jgi:hypothetical protein
MTASGAEWMTQEAPSYHKIRCFREQRSCGLTVDDAKLNDVAYLKYCCILPSSASCTSWAVEIRFRAFVHHCLTV